MPEFLSNIELGNNEIKGILVDKLPSNPTGVDGKIYYNTSNDSIYFYNGTRWVKLNAYSWQLSVSRDANLNADQDLRRQDGVATSVSPYIIPFDCELYAITTSSDSANNDETWDLEVYKNDVLEYTMNIVNAKVAVANGLTNTFSSSDTLRIRFAVGTSGRVRKPSATLFFREV
jgi:hypothetical protein